MEIYLKLLTSSTGGSFEFPMRSLSSTHIIYLRLETIGSAGCDFQVIQFFRMAHELGAVGIVSHEDCDAHELNIFDNNHVHFKRVELLIL